MFGFKGSDSLSEQARGSVVFTSPGDQLKFSSLFTSMASSVSISISFSGTRLVLNSSTLGTRGEEESAGVSVFGEGAEGFLLTVVVVLVVVVVVVLVEVGRGSSGSLGMLGGEKGDSIQGEGVSMN